MDFSERFRVEPGSEVKLARVDAGDTAGYKKGKKVKAEVEGAVEKLDELQELLYAEKKRSLLIVLQGLDAAGKDGIIRHVMAGVNPQGCRVTAFKAPSEEELNHDFLWRIHKAVPGRGEIGIFNRSHYEDVLVVRVHDLVPEKTWKARYVEINEFEKYLEENGTRILKFYLHISRREQKKRLAERMKDPRKEWKLSIDDLKERRHWDEYQRAYEDALTRCSTAHSPWFIIPSDHKWFRNLAVSHILVEALGSLHMKYPKPDRDTMKAARRLAAWSHFGG